MTTPRITSQQISQAAKLLSRATHTATSYPGLTSQALKQQYTAAIPKSETFKPQGLSLKDAKAYLDTNDGTKYLSSLAKADPRATPLDLQTRALSQIRSGLERPRTETLTVNDSLVKIVPKGTPPTPYSPYWAKESVINNAEKEGKNLSDHFALPIASENARYDVFRITPKQPTEVFVNTVAPTSELNGAVTKTGGAEQSLVPNRQLFSDPVYVRSVDNMRSLTTETERSGASPNLSSNAATTDTHASEQTAPSTPVHSTASTTIQRIAATMEHGDRDALRKEGEAFDQSRSGQAITERARTTAPREALQPPSDPRDSRHPDHALNNSIRTQVETLHTRNGLFPTNSELDRLTAGVALNVREKGLTRVDQLDFNSQRTAINAEQKGHGGGYSVTTIQQALQTTPEQSYRQMAQETQRQATVQQTAPQQVAPSQPGPSQGR